MYISEEILFCQFKKATEVWYPLFSKFNPLIGKFKWRTKFDP